MIKRLILAAAASAALTGAAFAQDQPAATDTAVDPAVEACLQKAFDLAQSAEDKKLDDGQLDQLEKMLGEMEGHCDAKEQAEADKVGEEIRAMLDAK